MVKKGLSWDLLQLMIDFFFYIGIKIYWWNFLERLMFKKFFTETEKYDFIL